MKTRINWRKIVLGILLTIGICSLLAASGTDCQDTTVFVCLVFGLSLSATISFGLFGYLIKRWSRNGTLPGMYDEI